MNSVLIFSGRSAIDEQEFRWQMLRVPEVSMVLKEAQNHLDQVLEDTKDLAALMMSENDIYLSSQLWREFLSQIVQVGLYNRYTKLAPAPRFVVGKSNSLSALNACFLSVSITELVENFVDKMDETTEKTSSQGFLVGQSMENIKAYEVTEQQLITLSENKQVSLLLGDIAKDHLLDHVVSVGTMAKPTSSMHYESEDLAITESVSMDPMLSWLWPYLQKSA